MERFIQVSAAGADVNSPSPFARSKVPLSPAPLSRIAAFLA